MQGRMVQILDQIGPHPGQKVEIALFAVALVESCKDPHDLGVALGVGGHLTTLRRIQSGSLANPVDWSIFQTAMDNGTWMQYLTGEAIVLSNIPAMKLTPQEMPIQG